MKEFDTRAAVFYKVWRLFFPFAASKISDLVCV